ncbi:MAG: NADH-quinone oxidoreductase subunit C [bacterium]|nr:NADH-quinone oxidoreductase subunit C [bacterium]
MIAIHARDWLGEWTGRHADGFVYLDFLTAVDRVDRLEIVAHALNPDSRERVLASAVVTADDPQIDSLSTLYTGASWHERETSEMFGIVFVGLQDARQLLLRTNLGAPPMRRSAVLAARVALDWPGTAEPGGSPSRRRQRPPGVPDEWLETRS